MSKSHKLFYDPIHGYLKFGGNCLQIIDSEQFKRLQHIKQLGACYYVFPGATHYRFEHSLGVAHLAEKMLVNIQHNQPELSISTREIELVKIAGLCHDLGHGPFSHAFDMEILPKLLPAEQLTEHEDRSGEILECICQDKSLDLTSDEIAFVKRCIHPTVQQVTESHNPYLLEIVANPRNGIDVDKFDYLRRDPYNLGLDYSVNSDRLISEARVIDGHICYPTKLAQPIIQMFSVRYNFLREICNHPVVKAIEYMITDAHLQSPLVSNLIRTTINKPTFAKITDEVLYLVEMSPDPGEAKAQEIISRLKQRDIYRYVGQITTKDHRFGPLKTNGLALEKLAEYGLDHNDVIVQHLQLSYTNNGMYPLRNVEFYQYDEPNIRVNVPKSKLGNLLPHNFCERNTIRIFSRSNHEKVKQLMEYLVEMYQK